MRSTRTILLVTIAIIAAVIGPIPRAATAAATAAIPSDFNGDGYGDLAVGVPHEAVGSGRIEGGAVNILYGSATGLSAAGDQYWSQDSPGVKGVSLGVDENQEDPFDRYGDLFGVALASGDFDRDGFADLAIGVPGDWVGSSMDVGAVNVLYGSTAGLTASGDQLWTGVTLGTEGLGESVGWALASGDFDGDGFWDLAIGGRGRDLDSVGPTTVLSGGRDGLTITGATPLPATLTNSQDSPEVTLAAGDFDGDGLADLAIGQPGAVVAGVPGAGGVVAFSGTPDGLTIAGSQIWTQDSPGIDGEPEGGDGFGGSLAIGDFDADGFGDLAVGVRSESIAPCCEFAGAANVLYGSGGGLTPEGSQFWHEDVAGVPDAGEQGDGFGEALAAGDFDGNGFDDLAIGAPGESAAAGLDQGAVITLYGRAGGLSAMGAQMWTQASAGVPGAAEDFDGFGTALASANYGRSRREDLAIGVPYEWFSSCPRYCPNPGVVDLVYGRASGLSGINAQVWSQNSAGVKGTAEGGDFFGSSLAH